jgi:translation initiation factor 3 subunit K
MGEPTKESIDSLLSKSPYSASNQAALEAYVDAEAKGSCPYHMDANRCLLKLYQISPQSAKDDKVALVLLLALLEFPSTDLLALSYLVPERTQKSEPSATILKCGDLMKSCKFVEFWETLALIEGDEKVKSLASGSDEKFQRAILEVLALTYKTAKSSQVLAALKMTSTDEISKLSHPCVESISGDVVVFTASAENTKRNRVFQEGVNFGAIASMMAKVICE